MLHVLITCLDVTSIKTCVYTCTTSEPHLIIICLYYVAHLYSLDVLVYPNFDDLSILTCIPYFVYVFIIMDLASCI